MEVKKAHKVVNLLRCHLILPLQIWGQAARGCFSKLDDMLLSWNGLRLGPSQESGSHNIEWLSKRNPAKILQHSWFFFWNFNQTHSMSNEDKPKQSEHYNSGSKHITHVSSGPKKLARSSSTLLVIRLLLHFFESQWEQQNNNIRDCLFTFGKILDSRTTHNFFNTWDLKQQLRVTIISAEL